ncbi:cytochrome bd-I oxidase subunit CydX [Paracoccus jiaweipingae]|uniref:cytochrome bd-I oxidase subunit CydX n=1 Tax=unclassified Paracoccus (in: a-proteobacteria) TaxID=2688777 RepID=UPI0037A34595
MWYFAWMLGLPLAALFAVVNAIWLELDQDRRIMAGEDTTPTQPPLRSTRR